MTLKKPTSGSRAIVLFSFILIIALISGVLAAGAGTVPKAPDDDGSYCGEPVGPVGADQPVYNAANAAGVLPCGVFEICGHGPKTVAVGDYAACGQYGANLTVFCMDENGNWTPQEVSDVGVSANGEVVTFYSGQHGTCALFPTSGAQPAGDVISGD